MCGCVGGWVGVWGVGRWVDVGGRWVDGWVGRWVDGWVDVELLHSWVAGCLRSRAFFPSSVYSFL